MFLFLWEIWKDCKEEIPELKGMLSGKKIRINLKSN
jgi:hypothetical protein